MIKLGTRILLGFASLLVLLVIMTALAVYGLNTMNTKLEKIADVNDVKNNYANTMSTSILQISRSIRGFLLVTDEKSSNEEKMNLEDAITAYDQALNALENFSLDEQGKLIITKIKESANITRPFVSQTEELGLANKKVEAISFFLQHTKPAITEWLKNSNEFRAYQTEFTQADVKVAKRVYQGTLTLLMIFGIIAILSGFSITYFITRSITKPINQVVEGLTEGAGQVAAASNQLSAAAQQLSQGSAEQASAIEETSSTLQETSSMLQQNTSNTKQAALITEQAKESMNKGSTEMQEMMSSIQELKRSSDQIAKIIKVIDDIAFQTNILALNAAIEAARAGEAGMGFAVVAEEVRNLAGRSAQAAKDTTAIIEANIELSTKGVAVAQRVGDALGEIAVQAKKVNDLMVEIAAAIQEQAQGVEQVNKGMGQMETVTQQNAANAEESASASEELSAQADNMRKIVQDLSQLVNGKTAAMQLEMNHSGHEQHYLHQSGQAVKAIGTARKESNSSKSLLQDKKTKVISPEDVIPLEKDPHQF